MAKLPALGRMVRVQVPYQDGSPGNLQHFAVAIDDDDHAIIAVKRDQHAEGDDAYRFQVSDEHLSPDRMTALGLTEEGQVKQTD